MDYFRVGCKYCEGLSNAGRTIEQNQNCWNKTKAKRGSEHARARKRLMKYGLQDLVEVFDQERQDMVAKELDTVWKKIMHRQWQIRNYGVSCVSIRRCRSGL